MEKILEKKLWEVAGRYLGEDPMHGLPHIRRVYKNFTLSAVDKTIGPATTDALEISVILHDIGRSVAGQSDHAAKGAEELGKLFQGELSEIKNQEWIINAVAKHSVGLEGKVDDDGDMVLALLCLFDHMDCLGPVGIHRLTLYWCGGQPYKIPWIPKEGLTWLEVNNLKYLLNTPGAITQEMMPMREHSFLECLVFFHGITYKILQPVKNILSNQFFSNIDWRLETMKWHAKGLISGL